MKAQTLVYRQFSLRFAFIVVTALAISFGVYANHLTRQRELQDFVERYHAALDNQRHAEADSIARAVFEAFPNHPLAEFMVRKQHILRDLQAGKPISGGFQCQ